MNRSLQFIVGVAVLATMLVAGRTPSRAADRPLACCLRAATTPVIDGRLSEGVWMDAQELSHFPTVGERASTSVRTQVRAIWDRDRLFIGFHCLETNLRALRAETEKRDDGDITRDDHVAVLLVPPSADKPLRLLVNCIGAVYDEWPDRGGLAWNGNWEAAVGYGEGYWEVELAIPFVALGVPPHDNQVWGFNVGRTAPSHGQVAWWSPGSGDEAAAESAGELRFLAHGPVVRLLSLGDEFGDLPGSTAVRMELFNPTVRRLPVTVRIRPEPPSDEAPMKQASLRLDPGERLTFSGPYSPLTPSQTGLALTVLAGSPLQTVYRTTSLPVAKNYLRPVIAGLRERVDALVAKSSSLSDGQRRHAAAAQETLVELERAWSARAPATRQRWARLQALVRRCETDLKAAGSEESASAPVIEPLPEGRPATGRPAPPPAPGPVTTAVVALPHTATALPGPPAGGNRRTATGAASAAAKPSSETAPEPKPRSTEVAPVEVRLQNDDRLRWRAWHPFAPAPDDLPAGAASGQPAICFLCPGESEAVSWVVATSVDFSKLEIVATDLTGAVDKIPRSHLDVRVLQRKTKDSPWLLVKDATGGGAAAAPTYPEARMRSRAGEAQLVWLTIHAPTDAAPGVYDGACQVRAGTVVVGELQVSATVLPLRLPAASVRLAVDYTKVLTAETSGGRTTTAEEVARDFRDITAHGCRGIALHGAGEGLVALLSIHRRAGLGTPVFCAGQQAGKSLSGLRQRLAGRGFPSLVFLWQVGGDHAAARKRKLTAAGVRLAAVGDLKACPDAARSVHFQMMDIEKPATVERLRAMALGEEPRTGPPLWLRWSCSGGDPRLSRLLSGFYLWKAQVAGGLVSPYQSEQHASLTRPGKWGPVPSVEWEAVREGLDDVRYLLALEETMRRAATGSPSPMVADLIVDGKQYLARVRASVQLRYRLTAGEHHKFFHELRWGAARRAVNLLDAWSHPSPPERTDTAEPAPRIRAAAG